MTKSTPTFLRLLPALLLTVAIAFATVFACVTPDAEAGGGGDPSAPPSSAAGVGVHKVGPFNSGLYPVPNDGEVPMAWMPPGSSTSPNPSDKIFPPQTIPIRFNHKKHIGEFKLSCKVCHGAAFSSDDATDHLLPKPTETCDNCHDVDHSNLAKVTAGPADNGQCAFCHLGDNAGLNGKVAKLVIPRANLRFTHKKHIDKNIKCAQCHGDVAQLELATRDQLPRMAGCFTCHQMSGASEGGAKGQCTNCHLTEPSGQMATEYSSGELVPPDWLHQAGHDADWIERHKTIAANDSKFCANCHREEYCTACHDGKVRNRKIHPNDWISMHPEAARMNSPRCTSCHAEQTFCADCHRRVGVARDGPAQNGDVSGRFHPPREIWTNAPRGPGHHAWEAQENINACVSCHTERDCTTCHATRAIVGGGGVNPHPVGFLNKCKTAFSRNPRPCLVCHQSSDSNLRECE